VSEFLTVLTAVLPIFCIAGTGALLRQLNWLTDDADASLLLQLRPAELPLDSAIWKRL